MNEEFGDNTAHTHTVSMLKHYDILVKYIEYEVQLQKSKKYRKQQQNKIDKIKSNYKIMKHQKNANNESKKQYIKHATGFGLGSNQTVNIKCILRNSSKSRKKQSNKSPSWYFQQDH